MKVGDPASEDSDLGALVSFAHRDKVESYIHLAQREGGEILCGGRFLTFLHHLTKEHF